MSNENVDVFFDYAGGSLDVNLSGDDCATVHFFADGISSEPIYICDWSGGGAGIDWDSVNLFDKDGDILSEDGLQKEHEKLAKKYGIEALNKHIKFQHESAKELLKEIDEIKEAIKEA